MLYFHILVPLDLLIVVNCNILFHILVDAVLTFTHLTTYGIQVKSPFLGVPFLGDVNLLQYSIDTSVKVAGVEFYAVEEFAE